MQHRCDEAHKHTRANEKTTELERRPEPAAGPATVAKLPGIATQLIGERMRTMYTSMVREPVPDDLLQLIRQLESKEGSE
jgi:hypothetical protein